MGHVQFYLPEYMGGGGLKNNNNNKEHFEARPTLANCQLERFNNFNWIGLQNTFQLEGSD